MHYLSTSRKQLDSESFPIFEYCRIQADNLRKDGTLYSLVQASLWEDFRSNLPKGSEMTPLSVSYVGTIISYVAASTEPNGYAEGFCLKAHPWISAALEELRAVLPKADEHDVDRVDNNRLDGKRNR